jgi:hypothetical protein
MTRISDMFQANLFVNLYSFRMTLLWVQTWAFTLLSGEKDMARGKTKDLPAWIERIN